jgi:hypothetical protein
MGDVSGGGSVKWQIRNRYTNDVMFEVEAETVCKAVERKVEENANLFGANLSGADLFGANLSRANLSGTNLPGADLFGAEGINKYLCTPLLILKDQPGPIRAYKLINSKGEGPYNGGINYLSSDEFTAKANIDDTIHCGTGINLATLDWCMREWREGYRILIMEFTAKKSDGSDNICIPIATDGKFRVSTCKRVGEVDLVKIGLVKEVAA